MDVELPSLVEGDTGPALEVYLTGADGEAQDLTGATSVTLELLDERTMEPAGGVCSVVTPAQGLVSYQPTGTDTVRARQLVGRFRVVYPGGAQSHPSDGVCRLAVLPRTVP